MNISHIEYFIEVCRFKSFTKAAEALFISQQGISKSIKRLEDDLGVPLFVRHSSSLTMTKYAEAFLPRAQAILLQYRKSMSELESLKAQRDGELKLGIPHGLVNFIPSWILARFNNDSPEIVFAFSEYGDYELDRALISGEVDVALCVLPVDMAKVELHHVHREQTYYMLSEQHPLAYRDSLDLFELKDEFFIGFGSENKGHAVLSERCSRAGFSPKMSVTAKDMHMIEELCRNNMGIGFFVGDSTKKIPGIKIIPDSSPDWYYSIGVATQKGKAVSSAARKFISLMKQW